MQGVGAIDSSGVNWLLQRRSRFRQEGGRLVLHSLPPTIENVLKMLRMQRVLEIAEDEASALAGLGEQLS
jgi:anti-anti-sigma factor